jgi:hypothetical protein
MPESTKLDFDISESDLTAVLMTTLSPGRARETQQFFESNLKYYKAFLEAWTDSNHRMLDSAAARARIVEASTSIEDQSRLVGQHTVEGAQQLAEEWARLSHQCLTLWASMQASMQASMHRAKNGGPPLSSAGVPVWPLQPGMAPPGMAYPGMASPSMPHAGGAPRRRPAVGAFAAEVSEAGEPHTTTEPGETTQSISSDGPGEAGATGAAPSAGPANSRSPKRRKPASSTNARKSP